MKFIDLFIRIVAMIIIPSGMMVIIKTNIDILKGWKEDEEGC